MGCTTASNDDLADIIQFDEANPITAHPKMQELVRNIVRRRGMETIDMIYGRWEDEDRQALVDMHNKVRSELARGEFTGKNGLLPSACNMNELKWSNALETVITNWIQCLTDPQEQQWWELAHIGYHNYKAQRHMWELYQEDPSQFEFELTGHLDLDVGENMFLTTGDLVSRTAEKTMTSSTNAIYSYWGTQEALHYEYGGSAGTTANGHFTAVINADTQYVGCNFCADEICGAGKGTQVLFGCNYWPAGNGNNDVYQAGSQCSCCEDGKEYCTTGDNAGLCTDTLTQDTEDAVYEEPTERPIVSLDQSTDDDDDDDDDDNIDDFECLDVSDLNAPNYWYWCEGRYVKTDLIRHGRPVWIQDFGAYFDPTWIMRNEDDTQWEMTDTSEYVEYSRKVFATCDKDDLSECGWYITYYDMENAGSTDGVSCSSAFVGEGLEDENGDEPAGMSIMSIIVIFVLILLLIAVINMIFCWRTQKKIRKLEAMEQVADNEEDVEMKSMHQTTA